MIDDWKRRNIMVDTQEDIILAEEDTQSASNEDVNNAIEVASEHKYSLK